MKSISFVPYLFLLATIGCRSQQQSQAQMPSALATQAVSKSPVVFLRREGESQRVYIRLPEQSGARPLTNNTGKWEGGAVVSKDGELVAYSLADSVNGRSEIWVAHADGTHAHRVTGSDEDAILPAFLPDAKGLLYVNSKFTGHYSPIAAPRKHKFDVMKRAISADEQVANAVAIPLTDQEFFDMYSLDVSPDGQHFLISTTQYPLMGVIEEFNLSKPNRILKLFQPHVPSEPREGVSLGQAVYINDGMDLAFTAASSESGGNYDYNVYSMSDVTGSDLKQLTHDHGMIDGVSKADVGKLIVQRGTAYQSLDVQTGTLSNL